MFSSYLLRYNFSILVTAWNWSFDPIASELRGNSDIFAVTTGCRPGNSVIAFPPSKILFAVLQCCLRGSWGRFKASFFTLETVKDLAMWSIWEYVYYSARARLCSPAGGAAEHTIDHHRRGVFLSCLFEAYFNTLHLHRLLGFFFFF